MLKLINLSTAEYYMDRYDKDKNKIELFLKNHNLNGVELLDILNYKDKYLSKEKIKGVHLKYYPMWIDFWNQDKESLLEDFKSVDDAINYYGGKNRQAIVNQYKNEIKRAEELEAEYVVFHVCNVKLKESYSYEFKYSDEEVINATIELVNEIFKGLDTNIKILFENLWWPGLTLLDKKLAQDFISKIKYENKGFMLDTGHLLNTNLNIKTEEEGIQYIVDVINNLGDTKEYIKGIHLNLSLSSKYVKNKIKEYNEKPNFKVEFNDDIYYHIYNIDKHRYFSSKNIRELLEIINPEYLIYEFISNSLDELNEFIENQDKAIGLLSNR